MKNSGKKGCVYLLADSSQDNIYKIGVTRGSVEDRIKKLQTGNSGEIYMCRFYETDYPFFLEKRLHFHFCPNKVRNEWFELKDEEVFEFLKECKKIEDMIEIMKGTYGFPKDIK